MDTTTAALQAHVTTATIRLWARRGIIAATKTAGRWIVDAASLAHRIAIGAMRPRKATTVTPITIADELHGYIGTLGVRGPAAALQTAFEAGAPVALTGAYAGESVYLGYTTRTPGCLEETIGLDHRDGDIAVYLIDEDRLAGAPQVSAAIDAIYQDVIRIQAAADDVDDAYLNNYYE